MNTFTDWLDDEDRNGYERFLWAAIIGVLKELGEELAEELADGLTEYIKESKTPNGWTKQEFLSYAIGRLELLKDEQVGPYIFDQFLDLGIASLVKYLTGKMTHEVIDDTGMKPPAPKDPYFPTRYGPDDTIDESKLFDGDLIYKDGLSRFVIPGRFRNYALYAMAAQGATLISIIGNED